MATKEIDVQLKTFERSDVFTPEEIAKRMVSYLPTEGTLLDPAVGSGNLLTPISYTMYERIDVYDIKQEYLDECPQKENLRKHCADFLKEPKDIKYDNIIANPPYIKIQDLSPEYRRYIKENWKKYSSGSFDLYIIFLAKCLEQLKDGGTMVTITPNSYLYNKSCKAFRKEIMENRTIKEIIDFKHNKVFPGTSVYTCITVLTKEPKTEWIYNGERVKYENSLDPEYNLFNAMNVKPEAKDESQTKRLADICTIKNGVATLCNEVYIHPQKLYEEPCWRKCKTSTTDKWIIYPYEERTAKVIDEEEFKGANPKTYEYLESEKTRLSNRDKGKKTYPMWYSYGRSQSLKLPKRSQVIYIPVFVDPANIQYAMDEPAVYSGCLCIELTTDEYRNEDVIDTIKKNIEYIQANSSKRGGGWINLSTKTLLNLVI
jgi:adenine-specific DNA-methyltransferase